MKGKEVEFSGGNFNPTLMNMDYFMRNPLSEMAIQDWKDIGLDITLKEVSRELRDTRWDANEGDIQTAAIAGIAGYVKRSDTFGRNFAPVMAFENPWSAFSILYQTNGEEGEEPPEHIKIYKHLFILQMKKNDIKQKNYYMKVCMKITGV
ncbi:MAG: hypothetical protein ACOC4G_02330 [Bacillota bacterium]